MFKTLRSLAALLAASLLAGCVGAAVIPPADRTAMRKELAADARNATAFARLAAQAYDCPDAGGTSLDAVTRCYAAPVSRRGVVAVYLVRTDDAAKRQVIAVRGTANWDDTRVDLRAGLVPEDDYYDVRVHQGFRSYAQAVLKDLQQNGRLKPGYKISLTGHSLGGAAAVLLGYYLYADADQRYDVDLVYTFGQPRVFGHSDSAALSFYGERVVRVVGCGDAVAAVPSLDYEHIGRSIIVTDLPTFWVTVNGEVRSDVLRDIFGFVRDTFRDKPIKHGIGVYNDRLEALTKDLDAAKPLRPTRRDCMAPAAGA